MRFTKSAWLMALVLLGVIGLVVVRYALAQQQAREVASQVATRIALVQPAPNDQPNVPNQDDSLELPETRAVFDRQTGYIGRLFASPPTGGGQDEPLSEWVQLDAKLAQQSQQLMDQYGAATDDADRAKLKDQLAQALQQQFDAQQKLRELEVSRIEARVKKLRDLIAKRNEAKRTIIDKRLDQLIRDAEGLGWSSPDSDAGAGFQDQRYQRYPGPAGSFAPVTTPPRKH